MNDNDILVEIFHSLGEIRQGYGGLLASTDAIKSDVAEIKADISQLRAAPAKKRSERLAVLGGFVGLASFVVMLLTKVLGR